MLVSIAALVLTLAVGAGALLAGLHARGYPVAPAAGLAHGGLAIAGVVLLLVGIVLETHGNAINVALFLLVVAALGGVFVLLFRFEDGKPPMFMILLHGGIAVTGLGVLWLALTTA